MDTPQTQLTPTSTSTKLIDRIRTGKQDFGHGVSAEMIEDGRIIFFDVLGFSRKAVDVWADTTIQVLTEEDRVPVLILFNLAKTGISAHSRKRSQDIVESAKTNKIRVGYAMVVNSDIVGQAIRVYANMMIGLSNPDGIDGKVFTNQADAIRYLKQFAAD